jgi:hypothetical protein
MYMPAEQTNFYATLPALPGTTVGCGGAGLGCADCGGKCGGGLGLFESGLDYSAWGWQEYAAVALGVYVLSSVFFATSRGVKYAAGSGERRRRARVSRISKQLEDARRR